MPGGHLIIWDVFHKPTTSIIFSLLVFQQLRLTFLEGWSSSSFVAEVGIFFNILLFQLSIFYFFLPEALCCCFLQTFFLPLSRACSFRAYPFNRRCAFWLKFSSPYQALHLFSTGVLSEIFLTPCSIHSIVPEEACCDFIECHLILLLIQFFLFQLESCLWSFLPLVPFIQ